MIATDWDLYSDGLLPASDPEIGFNQILFKQVIYQKISDINILISMD